MTKQPPDESGEHVLGDQFARHLEQEHQQIIDGQDRALDPSGSVASDSRLEQAIPVLKLLEEVRRFKRSQPNALVDTHRNSSSVDLEGKDSGTTDAFTDGLAGGKRIGRFEIHDTLGKGGFGLVLRGRDKELDRDVAIKIPRPEYLLTEDAQHRFMREAKTAAALSHPNIVTVYESGNDRSVFYLVSEFIPGESLADWLARAGGPVDSFDSAHLVSTLADALQHAHSRHVLHRDIKPGNILLEIHDHQDVPAADLCKVAKITDFGLAKFDDDVQSQTQTGSIVGTPTYMAPEQTTGDHPTIDGRADIYSLGTVLYELLTGSPPFRRSTVLETIAAVQKAEPRQPRQLEPNIPKDLQAICLKCLEKDPHKRYESAHHLRQDLQRFLNGRPVEARDITNLDRLYRWAIRNPALSVSIAGLAVVITAALVTTTALWVRSDFLRRQSDARQELADSRKLIADQRLANLQEAIDTVYDSLKVMPEIDSQEFKQFRRELLSKVNQQYTSLVSETPADDGLKRKKIDSLLKLVALKSRLDDTAGALAIATKIAVPSDSPDTKAAALGQRIEAMILAAEGYFAEKDHAQGKQYLSQALGAARQQFVSVRNPQLDDRVDLATTLSQASRIAASQGLQTLANELSIEAIGVWETIDADQISDDETILEMANTFLAAAEAHGKSEKVIRGRMYSQFVIDLLTGALSAETKRLPEVRFTLAKAYFNQAWSKIGFYDECRPILVHCQETLDSLVEQHPAVPKYRILHLRQRYYWGLIEFIKAGNAVDSRHHRLIAQSIFQRNVNQADELLVRFPDHEAEILKAKLGSWEVLGSTTGLLGDYAQGVEILEEVRSVHRQLYEQTGSNRNLVRLSAIDGNIAELMILSKDYQAAIDMSQRKIDDLQTILESDPDAGQVERYISNGYLTISRAHRKLAQFDEAWSAFQRAKQYQKFEPIETMFGEEAVHLLNLERVSEAREKFQAFVTYCEQADQSQRIVTTAVMAIEAIEGHASAEDADTASLRSFFAEAAISALEELKRNAADAYETLIDSVELDPLKNTPEFADWNR